MRHDSVKSQRDPLIFLVACTYVPNHNGLLLPLHPHLEIRSVRDVIVQEFQQGITFFLLIPNDVAGD